jgi:ferredoxin
LAVSFRLVLNPIKCVAHGMCAELFPERIALDDWGYPMIDPTPIPIGLEEHARRAVAACPTLALALEREARDRA